MLSLRERAFRNLIFACSLVLFLAGAVLYTYVLGKTALSVIGALLLVISIFALIVTIDTWRKAKGE